MSGLFGGGLTNYQNGLDPQGGASQGMGDLTINENWGGHGSRLSLPGMNGEFGGKFYHDPFSAGNASVAQDAGNINMTGIGNMARGAYGTDRQVGGGFEGAIPAAPGSEPTPAPSVKRPGFLDVIKQGGDSFSNPGLSKGGKLLGAIMAAGRGAAQGSAGNGFGQGFMIAGQQSRQDEAQRQNEILRRIELARQQQQDARAAAEDQSQAALRQAQIESYKSQAGKREQTPAEALLARRDAAVGMGLKEGSDEYNKVVFDLSPQKEAGPGSPEQQYINEYHQKHPKASVAEAIKGYAADHQAPERDVNAGDKAIRRQARDLAGGLLGKHQNDSAAAAADAANQLNTNRNLTPGQRRILSETLLTLRKEEPAYAPQ